MNDRTRGRRLRRHALLALTAVASLALAACASDDQPSSLGTPSPSASVNTLTGQPGKNGPVVAVKVANTVESRPMSGLPQASQVWVEEIERGRTRFIALYDSAYPEKIGPVRSGRETDLTLLPQWGKPGYAYAGADTPVQAEITKQAADGVFVDLGKDAKVDGTAIRPTSYFTDAEREVPYNFYANGSALAGFATKGGAEPAKAGGFQFGTPTQGDACQRLDVTWSKLATGGAHWDSGANAWIPSFDGKDLTDRESGAPLTATNIVVVRAPDVKSDINLSVYPVPIMQTYGADGGDAIVLTNGSCTQGRWVRPTIDDPMRLTTTDGQPITLSPGQTWVYLVGTGPTLADGTERTATTS